MMKASNDYNFNLFKPTTEFGKKNRNVILSMLLIWAVAVFGFQILLKVLQKPTPEKALVTYESVIDNVKTGKATLIEKQDFINSLVSVLGKSTIKKEHKVIISVALGYMVFSMADSSSSAILLKNISDLQLYRSEIVKSANDEQFLQAKGLLDIKKLEITSRVAQIAGKTPGSLEASIIAFNLLNNDKKELGEEDINVLTKTMKLYLIHNQSFLTDTKFLGFPFHYFYTAEFLLILFVILCLIYSIRIEKLHKKYSITEE